MGRLVASMIELGRVCVCVCGDGGIAWFTKTGPLVLEDAFITSLKG